MRKRKRRVLGLLVFEGVVKANPGQLGGVGGEKRQRGKPPEERKVLSKNALFPPGKTGTGMREDKRRRSFFKVARTNCKCGEGISSCNGLT